MTPALRAELKAAVSARRRALTFRHDSRGRMVPVSEPGPRGARTAPTSPTTQSRSAGA